MAVEKYAIRDRLPKSVISHFEIGAADTSYETPKADNPIFQKTTNLIIGSNIDALLASKREADQRQYRTLILSSMIGGDTCEVAGLHAAVVAEVMKTGNPLQPPACILSGGETTVKIKGDGKGGRNQHFALSIVGDIAGDTPVVVLSGGTDGNDGPTDAAGAIVDNTTRNRANLLNMNFMDYLGNNDAYNFFHVLGDLLFTGPTNTNVMDVHIIVIPGLSE